MDHKIPEEILPFNGMCYFGMELYAEDIRVLNMERSHFYRGGRRDDLVAFRNRGDRIGMRHPYLAVERDLFQQLVMMIDSRELCSSILAHLRWQYSSARLVGDELRSVAHPRSTGVLPNFERSMSGEPASRTEHGLPERITPRVLAPISGILLKGWISQ